MSPDVSQLLTTAAAHHQGGQIDEAEAIYRTILSIDPNHANALHLLGVAASQRGRHQAAVESIGRAIALTQQSPVAEFHNNMGMAFRALGQLEKAIQHFTRATMLKPDYAQAHYNLGAALGEKGNHRDAAARYRRALSLKPDYARAHYGLGAALQAERKFDEAIGNYERALRLEPRYPEAHLNLGLILKEQDRLDEAAAQYCQALALKPDYAKAHFNLGIVLMEQGRLDDALAHYARAIALDPAPVEPHWNEALATLLKGDFAAGWLKYEARWRRKETPPRPFAQPLWDGGDLTGRTILLHAEQGIGDTIQFVRYARLVKQLGAAAVVVECQPGLNRLLEGAAGIDRLVTTGETLPAFDYYAPLLSLPRILGTVLETVPAQVPYLTPRADLVAGWTARGIGRQGLNVGIVWRGGPAHDNDRRRSIQAARFAPLCASPGTNWVSLQTDAKPDEIAVLSRNAEVRDSGPNLTDWAETAALMSCLDLIVTVDTAVAHLAGALGIPVWVLLPFAPDWRWMLGRSDSPWYPTMKLFRQPAPGDWDSVIARVQSELTLKQ